MPLTTVASAVSAASSLLRNGDGRRYQFYPEVIASHHYPKPHMYLPGLNIKLEEIREELRRLGLWQQLPPQWVACYGDASGADFAAWLQFIYLPNKLQYRQRCAATDLAPQAAAFFGELTEKSCLLQLLVELDALI